MAALVTVLGEGYIPDLTNQMRVLTVLTNRRPALLGPGQEVEVAGVVERVDPHVRPAAGDEYFVEIRIK